MNKLIYTTASLLLATLPFAGQAQTEKGSFLLGTNVGIANLTFGKGQGTYGDISLAPSAGYFVANNFAVGLHFTDRYQFNDIYKTNTLEVSPFARYYLPVKKDSKEHNLRFFGEVTAGIGNYHVSYGGSDSYSEREYFAGAGVGMAYFINPHISLETGLNMYGRKYSGTQDVQYNPSLSVGFNIYLFKEKK